MHPQKSIYRCDVFRMRCHTKWCALIHPTICTTRSLARTQLLMLVHYYHCLSSIANECNCSGSNRSTNPIFPNCIPLLFWQLCLIVVFSIPKQNFFSSLSLSRSNLIINVHFFVLLFAFNYHFWAVIFAHHTNAQLCIAEMIAVRIHIWPS